MFLKRKTKKKRKFSIYMVTDIHGSELCFRKLVNSYAFYKPDVVILGGDVTGKMVVPIIPQNAGRYMTMYSARELILDGEEEMKRFEKTQRDMGFYPKVISQEEFDVIKDDKDKQEQIFHEAISERIQQWVDYANEKLKGTDKKIICAPGNDDELWVDELIEQSDILELAEGKRLIFDDKYEVITCAWTNPTPWDTPRECSDEELEPRLKELAESVEDLECAVFNLHAPPYESKLDECPKLDENLKPVLTGGQVLFIPVGSKSVRKIIETYQPLLGLHGHIHEGKGSHPIGRTICVNPGSVYTEGMLQGALIELEPGKVNRVQLTTG